MSPATRLRVRGAGWGGLEGWPAGRDLAGDGDDAAWPRRRRRRRGRSLRGGGCGLRVPARCTLGFR
jgi:hypothetical protein